jgi:hypothetical protein
MPAPAGVRIKIIQVELYGTGISLARASPVLRREHVTVKLNIYCLRGDPNSGLDKSSGRWHPRRGHSPASC